MVISAKEKNKARKECRKLGMGCRFGQGQPRKVSPRRWLQALKQMQEQTMQTLGGTRAKGRPQAPKKTFSSKCQEVSFFGVSQPK